MLTQRCVDNKKVLLVLTKKEPSPHIKSGEAMKKTFGQMTGNSLSCQHKKRLDRTILTVSRSPGIKPSHRQGFSSVKWEWAFLRFSDISFFYSDNSNNEAMFV